MDEHRCQWSHEHLPDRLLELVPPSLLALDLGSLVGLPVDEARGQVEAAGGRLVAGPPGAPKRMSFAPKRVTAYVDETCSIVARVRGIG